MLQKIENKQELKNSVFFQNATSANESQVWISLSCCFNCKFNEAALG